ncbi:MAG TPA: polysaccharide deacetylase family protein [Solirubrobacterales bacterium]|nr:polysaccharide deacetylase family protein [Solirubrobacterales bacterium]
MHRIGRVFAALLALALLAGTPFLASTGTAARARHGVVRSTSSPRLSVLAYHAIDELENDPVLARYSVPPVQFAEQLDHLRERGWNFVSLDQVLAAFDGGPHLPPRAVLLTFDDAYTDLRDAACPVLSERGIPGVAFAVAGQIGGTNVWDSEIGATSLDLLDGDGLREISRGGIEVGAHTVNHRPLTRVPSDQLEEEIHAAADLLEGVGLPRPRAFSYPYGNWDQHVANAVRDAGYEVAFTVDRGVVQNGVDLHALPRIAVHACDTPRRLHLKLATASWPGPVRAALRWLDGVRRRV